MEVTVRPERTADIDAIRRINDLAFDGPDEGRIVDAIRGTADWLEGGSLVAVAPGGHLVGDLLLSQGELVGTAGDSPEIWMLGPVAVLPEVQRRGAGSALTRAAISLAVSRRVPLICVLGHATYYPRFGFEPARPLGIEPPQDWPDDVWQALRLPGWVPGLRGVARYSPAFGVEPERQERARGGSPGPPSRSRR